VSPQLPPPPEKPVLLFDGMAVVADPFSAYREAVHLSWTTAAGEAAAVASYTLLRKIQPDTVYDVFAGSRLIPADTADFCDGLTGFTFPANGFDSIFYRICAVDTFGRTGDTSDACPVILAPQPDLIGFDTAQACLRWESWIRGGVFSWCTVWNARDGRGFTGEMLQEFPFTDQPARFSQCFPDSLSPPAGGRWYYALYIRANESYSLVIGSLDAP
jgi:hypothetical protein